jgi:thioredoxin reductase
MRVAVVGAGPAGIAAVARLVAAGVRPVWLDEAPDGGGRIFHRPPKGFRRDHAALYGTDAKRAADTHALLDRLRRRADWRPGALVWNLRPAAQVLDVLRGDGRQEEVAYDAVLLCTGAMDRVVPLPGWTLPGVTTLGGAQIALKAQGCAIGTRVVLLGTGPLLYLLARQYAKAGARTEAVLDTTGMAVKARAVPSLLRDALGVRARETAAMIGGTLARGVGLHGALRLGRVPFHEGVTPLAIEGAAGRVQAIRWRDVRGREHRTECDAVAMGWGLKPEAQLADLAGVPFGLDPTQRNWVPRRDPAGRTPVRGVYLAGDGAGIGGAEVAALSGARAALALLEDAGIDAAAAAAAEGWAGHYDAPFLDDALRRLARFRAALERASPFPAHLAASMPDATLLCRCESITAGALRAAAREAATASGSAAEVNRAKALTRVGMGRCQGRVCGPAAAEVLADALGCTIEQAGRLRGQPPVKPIPVMALPA